MGRHASLQWTLAALLAALLVAVASGISGGSSDSGSGIGGVLRAEATSVPHSQPSHTQPYWSGNGGNGYPRSAPPPLPTATVHFPLRRSGPANRKMVARALSNRPEYKRLLAANAHGARLNTLAAAKRRESAEANKGSLFSRAMAPLAALGADGTALPTASGVAPLAGCPFADFTIPVTIGAATFELIVDTGSATLALAGSSCTTCVAGGVSPLWAASKGSLDQNAATQGTYGDSTGWRGEIWRDSVALSDASGRNITLPARMRIVVITAQSTSGQRSDGSRDPDANPFFVVDSCADQTSTYQKAIVSQGIVGLALQGLATPGTDSFTSALHAQQPHLPQVFSMQMCEGSGNLWWGGLPPREFVVGASGDSSSELGVLYTPLYGSSFYTVAPSDIYIGSQSQGLSPQDFYPRTQSSNAVDSGTTLWELPLAVYRRVVDVLLAEPGFKRYFRAAPGDNFFDHAMPTCERAVSSHTGRVATYQQLQRELPTITLQFTNGLSVTMDGVGSYLLPCNKEYDQWTPGIVGASSGFLGGWPFMNQFITVHDVANMRMGFAPAKRCETGVQSLQANVTMGAPHPLHVEPSLDDGIAAATGPVHPALVAGRALLFSAVALLAMAAFAVRI